MTTTDREKGRKDLVLLSQEDVARIERSLTASEPGPLPTGFGFVEPPPPYCPGPRRKLPSWAKHLRDLRPLKLVDSRSPAGADRRRCASCERRLGV